jgi:type I restriction enzyme M protein
MAFAEGDTRLVGKTLPLTDIAKLAEVGVSAGSNWRKRHADFPKPIVVSGQEFFAADAVALWLGKRKIPRNRLRRDESLGATYGDRFLRNIGASAQSAQTTPSHVLKEHRSEWVNQLWRIRDLLRVDLDFSSAFDFILAMLYVRTTNPELWRAVAGQRTWDTVDTMLRHVPFWDHYVPMFATASDRSSEGQLLKAISLFSKIDLDSVGPAALFDALLDSSNRDLGWRGGHFTPSSVASCLVDILGPHCATTVYDPSCGSGELLVEAARRGVESLFGQAMNERSLQMTGLNLLTHGGDAELRMGGLGITGRDKYDFVLANPPFNITLPEDFAENQTWPFGEPSKNGANFAWLQIAFNKLESGGHAGVIMPNGTLFAGGRNAAIRRKMIEAGVVDGIVALPAGLFADTGIAVSIWFLRRPKPSEPTPSEVVFIDATSMGVKSGHSRRVLREDEITKIVQEYGKCRNFGRSGSSDRSAMFARSVSIEEIQRNDYNLQPQLYLREESDSRHSQAGMASATLESLQGELDRIAKLVNDTRQDVDAHLKALLDSDAGGWEEASLGDICDIQAGPGAVDRERGMTIPDWIPLLLPRNIKRGSLSHDDLDTVRPEICTKLDSYRLQPGDIVCARSGTLGRHGLVREEEKGWLLGPSCLRLRPQTNGVVPEYLVHYLNSPEVYAWIKSESAGSTAIPHIRAARLRELVVPLPPVAVQRDIVTTIDSINAHVEQWQRGASTGQSLRDLVFLASWNSDLGLE